MAKSLLYVEAMSQHCPYCILEETLVKDRTFVVLYGSFKRKSDNSIQQRFLCRICRRSFSTASTELCYQQKKRHINSRIFEELVSGVSQRRLALILRVNRKTIVRKFIFLGLYAQYFLALKRNEQPPCSELQFDDLETFEHSKLKPLSVIMAVESKTRRILGYRVARMPAKGLLVKRSLKKYGFRKDERRKARRDLFKELIPKFEFSGILKSDENPHYKKDVREFFPGATHLTYLGRRGCVVGQGELKAIGFDPIFSLNHTFAMLRANINRLFRRTWNTTKKPERLELHIALYSLYHNEVLI